MSSASDSPGVPTRIACAVVGGGPAGLMAAETLAQAGVCVDVYDAMPSMGRKFLLAGKSGLNITHAEPLPRFVARYGARTPQVRTWLDALSPDALQAWAHALGIDTFVGSSGRVFPAGMKAAPLLRAWLARLRRQGVRLHVRHRFLGWSEGALVFSAPSGLRRIASAASVLALGGGSWARLGSDGAWVPMLRDLDVAVAPLAPANCGFERPWSAHFRDRFAGSPVKSVAAWLEGDVRPLRGEFAIAGYGVEGSLIYALSRELREALAAHGSAALALDLVPDVPHGRLADRLDRQRAGLSLANRLRGVGLAGVKAALVREVCPAVPGDSRALAALLKALPLRVDAPRPLDEAISSAGGVRFEALDDALMLREFPGVFCAGEMIDWEAPTGGYLLTACFASGRVAGAGAAAWLSGHGHGTALAQREPAAGDTVDRPDAK